MDALYLSINRTGFTQKPGKEYDWAAYNAGFEPDCLSVGQFYEAACQGHSFAPVFEGRRCQEDFYLAQHVALDFDNVDKDKQPVKNPWTLQRLLSHPFVAAYAAFIYPTLSATPDNPRYRVVFALSEPVREAGAYKAILSTLHALFPDADSACLDISRTFFGNGLVTLHGLWQDTYYGGHALPLPHLRLYAARLRQQQQRPQRRAVRQGAQPPGDLGLQDVVEQMQGVDPYAMPYDEWLQLGAALAHTFGDAAFEPFKRWSDTPDKPPFTWRKWQSLSGPHPRPTGPGTIVHLLSTYGGQHE